VNKLALGAVKKGTFVMMLCCSSRIPLVHNGILIILLCGCVSISSAFLNTVESPVSRMSTRESQQQRQMWNNKNNDLRLYFSIPNLNTNNNNNNNNNNEDDSSTDTNGEQPATLIETIGGGTATIFEMARRMLIWDDDSSDDDELSEDEKRRIQERDNNNLNGGTFTATTMSRPQAVLPRWHPHSGISDVNPSFRTQSPIMNSQGYATTIWRNVRKRNKPSLWRHALRTYDRMEAVDRNGYPIERTTSHHEGALLACAKLGLWQKAIDIFQNDVNNDYNAVVTDNMIFSLVKACVRGCKKLNGEETSLEERRAPLDAGANIMIQIIQNSDYDIPLVARHLNPLSAGYQSLGLVDDAKSLIQKHLTDRSRGPEPETGGQETFNVHDMCAKDKASYALLVKGAVASGNWADAVEALEDMTEAGLYPNSRNLNSWTEATERKTKQRTTRSWKKKRDEYWLESVS